MSDRTPHPRFATVALAVAAVLALSACAGIPTGGSVATGNVINDEANPNLGFEPKGPRVDSPQEEILSDFIAAATNPQSGYEIAREFLSQEFAQEWDPDELTTIRSGAGTVRRDSEIELSYSLSTSASVSRDGRYSAGDPASLTLPFTFVKENDQWRISSAPPGIVLSQNNFPQVFGEYPLFYFDPSGAFLVPDVRWFPTRSSTSIRVVSSLLAGQSPWLSNGVVVSAFPAGTQLGEGLVTITAGVATVDLSDEARSTTTVERQRMRQQLSTSLAVVSSVVITVGGIPLEIPDTDAAAAVANPTVEPAPLVLADGEFGFAAVNDINPIPQLSNKVVALAPTAVALASGKSQAAVRNPQGVYVVRTGATPPQLVDARPGLVAPSIDSSGFVWSVPSSNAAALTAFELDGAPHVVGSTLPADAGVVSMAVSRDGTRLLMYLMTSAGPQLNLYGIVRQDGVPIALGEPFPLQVGKSTPVGAAWVDNRTVATLSLTGSETTVTTFEVGGPSTALGQLEGGATIVGGNGGSDGLRVLTEEGEIFRPRGTSWQQTGTTATLLAVQQ